VLGEDVAQQREHVDLAHAGRGLVAPDDEAAVGEIDVAPEHRAGRRDPAAAEQQHGDRRAPAGGLEALLFALFYAATGLAVAVYYRRLAVTGAKAFFELALLPLASAAFLAYVIVRSVPDLGGWTGKNMTYLYVLLGVGVLLMLYARWRKESDYFQRPLEAYDANTAETTT